jgi:hypothetical protein
MSTVAFPSGYNLSRSSTFRHHPAAAVDVMSDGTPRARTLTTGRFVTVSCLFEYLTLTEMQILLLFLLVNEGNTVTWTIDGISYSGMVTNGQQRTMTGPLFSVTFEYYAQIV